MFCHATRFILSRPTLAMGCSTSRGVKVVEAAENPDERPKSSCSARSRAGEPTEVTSTKTVEPAAKAS
ncbi:unnamed protein product [Lota lota]